MISVSVCLQRRATDQLGPLESARPMRSYTTSRDIIVGGVAPSRATGFPIVVAQVSLSTKSGLQFRVSSDPMHVAMQRKPRFSSVLNASFHRYWMPALPPLRLTALRPACRNAATGPDLPFSPLPIAALQLHQTGHSSIAQRYRRMKVGRADETVILQDQSSCQVRGIQGMPCHG